MTSWKQFRLVFLIVISCFVVLVFFKVLITPVPEKPKSPENNSEQVN